MQEILLLNQKMRKQIFNTNEDAHTHPDPDAHTPLTWTAGALLYVHTYIDSA